MLFNYNQHVVLVCYVHVSDVIWPSSDALLVLGELSPSFNPQEFSLVYSLLCDLSVSSTESKDITFQYYSTQELNLKKMYIIFPTLKKSDIKLKIMIA